MIINDEILIRYLDDHLDPDVASEVTRAIREDETVARRLLELSEHEVMLQEAIEVMGEASSIVTETRKNKRLRQRSRAKTAILAIGSAVAAGFAIALAVWLWPRPTPTESGANDPRLVEDKGTPAKEIHPLMLVPIEEALGSEVLPTPPDGRKNRAKPNRNEIIHGRVLSIDSKTSRIEIGTDSGKLRSLKVDADTVIMGYGNLLGPINLDDRVQASVGFDEEGSLKLRRLVVRPPAVKKPRSKGKPGTNRFH